MVFELTTHSLGLLLQQAAELGAEHALAQIGIIRPYLSKSEAFRVYGTSKVQYWLTSGLLTPRKDGDHSAAWRIDRLEIEVLTCTTNLIGFF